jgi:hypothetical protein
MNAFYELNRVLQLLVALLMLVMAGGVTYLWFELFENNLVMLFLIFVITPVLQFLIAPSMKLIGMYRYVSPMLLIYAPNKKKFDLHNGTSFDYIFIYPKKGRRVRWQNLMLHYYLEGLLAIVDEIEQKKIPETIEIRGSSYFFSSRTAQKLGFDVKTAPMAEKLNILINYLDLLWMYSLANGRFSLPKLNVIKTATTTGKRLAENRGELERMNRILSNRMTATRQ